MNPRSFNLGVCAAITIASLLLTQAQAQVVSTCQPTPPNHFPPYGDSTPTSVTGWSTADSAADAKSRLVIGDIDGDGYDELIALPKDQNKIEVWRWSYTTWTPMVSFPNTNITTTLPGGNATQIRLADVDGDGRKELVIYVVGPGTTNDQEQTYKFDPVTYTWTLLNVYQSGKTDGPSYWFKAKTGDKQDTRFRLSATAMDIRRFQSGSWVAVPGNGTAIDRSSIATCATGKCIAFSDLNGDGLADLVWMHNFAYMNFNLSTATGFFTTALKQSAVTAPATPQTIDPEVLASWQMGDIAGVNRPGLIFDTPTGLAAYYFDPGKGDFAAYSDPNGNLRNAVGQNPGSLTIVPAGAFISGYGDLTGVVILGRGMPLFGFVFGGSAFSYRPSIESTLTPNGELNQTGYASYLRFANEPQGTVIIVRGPNGILSRIGTQKGNDSFTDPNIFTDRGFPQFSGAQAQAYRYISVHATGNNPDIRSLYTDPATGWPAILNNVQATPIPAAPAGVAPSDWTAAFQVAQAQMAAEIAAIESVNEFYAVTGRLLTNTYLVKDATLQEVTTALKLPSQPNISGTVLSGFSAAFNALGAAGAGVSSVLQIVSDSAQIANIINAAGSLSYVVGTISGDTSTYTASSIPDLTTGTYSLKLALDNASLGAATANTCHQLNSLSSWDQAKPLADGITSGLIPLDLNTQQDLLQATQSLFQVSVWQSLAATAWMVAPVTGFHGLSTYDVAWSIDAHCKTALGSQHVSLVLIDPNAHNFPAQLALQALFSPPPKGIGALVTPVMLGRNGWSLPVNGGNDAFFEGNTGLSNPYCSSVSFDDTSATPNLSSFDSALSAKPVRTAHLEGYKQALAVMAQLRADISQNLLDPVVSRRIAMDLEVASNDLQHAMLMEQEPDETLRLLNDVLTRLQFHGSLSDVDRNVATAGIIKAVTVRDLLLAAGSAASPAVVR
jgi:hypothetical protein